MLTAIRRWFRAMYSWTLRWSESPQALTAIFLIALVESSVFPIPPDVLLITIVAARPRAWLRAAAACSCGSAVGAVVGYAIGAGFMATLGQDVTGDAARASHGSGLACDLEIEAHGVGDDEVFHQPLDAAGGLF